MRISIFGLGYVGTVSLACLARDGHHVIGVDIDASKLAMLYNGRSPIIEVGIQELVLIHFTHLADIGQAVTVHFAAHDLLSYSKPRIGLP